MPGWVGGIVYCVVCAEGFGARQFGIGGGGDYCYEKRVKLLVGLLLQYCGNFAEEKIWYLLVIPNAFASWSPAIETPPVP